MRGWAGYPMSTVKRGYCLVMSFHLSVYPQPLLNSLPTNVFANSYIIGLGKQKIKKNKIVNIYPSIRFNIYCWVLIETVLLSTHSMFLLKIQKFIFNYALLSIEAFYMHNALIMLNTVIKQSKLSSTQVA